MQSASMALLMESLAFLKLKDNQKHFQGCF